MGRRYGTPRYGRRPRSGPLRRLVLSRPNLGLLSSVCSIFVLGFTFEGPVHGRRPHGQSNRCSER
jgi:hypothetical protein